MIIHKQLMVKNPTKKRKALIMFNDMIADIETNEKRSLIITKSFLKEIFLKFFLRVFKEVSLVFISQSYFKVLKTIRLNTLFYHENTQQKRILTNSIKSFM